MRANVEMEEETGRICGAAMSAMNEVRELVFHWRRTAETLRDVSYERRLTRDFEEAVLCKIEAERLEKCANELEKALAQAEEIEALNDHHEAS
ncbi:MAG: hypothetical protein FWD08_00230 [Alphaproteobacteria bacterium]|nr:hypothetical protein [Alphaproteobacteria bacterium]